MNYHILIALFFCSLTLLSCRGQEVEPSDALNAVDSDVGPKFWGLEDKEMMAAKSGAETEQTVMQQLKLVNVPEISPAEICQQTVERVAGTVCRVDRRQLKQYIGEQYAQQQNNQRTAWKSPYKRSLDSSPFNQLPFRFQIQQYQVKKDLIEHCCRQPSHPAVCSIELVVEQMSAACDEDQANYAKWAAGQLQMRARA